MEVCGVERILYLLCPLMMLFYMKSMCSSDKKNCHSTNKRNHLENINALKSQVHNLMVQNKKLSEEVKHLQSTKGNVI
ncbi:DUF2933 domain-containing protein [Peribacillus asahii]|uniref:DUF2933 domain-containing protein n=1 Tax=Peribacillus asahii TaxID=228899 RepID=UPI00207929B8|nr:DUF2933 domain-containing protein [Peribacillus asahii]USK62376.1 DUF2933 domain-containing protein [Peribacillus asahii]